MRGQAQVDIFYDAMLHELEANAWKGDEWQRVDPATMMLDGIYHAIKFLLALNDGDEDAAAELAADVGNCAWMAADAAGVLKIRDGDSAVAVPWRKQAVKAKRALGLTETPGPVLERWFARLLFDAPYGGTRAVLGTEDY